MSGPLGDTARVPTGSIKAVFFDAGGTLIEPYPSLPEIYAAVLSRLGIEIDPDALQSAAWDTWGEMTEIVGSGRDRYSHYEGGEGEFWRRFVHRVMERVGQADRAVEAARALHAAFSDPGAWRAFPEARDTLRALRARGLKLGVISNWDSRLRPLLEALDLAREFDAIVVSCEVRSEKPSPAIFRRGLEALGVRADEAFHIGDDLGGDYDGARMAGMEAALLVRSRSPWESSNGRHLGSSADEEPVETHASVRPGRSPRGPHAESVPTIGSLESLLALLANAAQE